MTIISPDEIIERHSNVETFKPLEKPKTPPAFEFTRADELEVKPTQWLVEGYIEQDAVAVLFSEPGVGKTHLALTLALSVATGTPWFGQSVRKGAVFIIAGEGFHGLARRLRAIETHHGISQAGAQLFITKTPAALCDINNSKLLLDAIEEGAAKAGCTPTLIIFDTLAKNFGEGDENSTADMNKAGRNCRLFCDKWQATVLILHHSGHGDKTRMRGGSGLKGDIEQLFLLVDNGNKHLTLSNLRMKDGREAHEKNFEIIPVTFEANGREISSATIEEIDAPNKKRVRLSEQKQRALDILNSCIFECGQARLVRSGMPPRMCVTLDEARLSFERANLSASDKPDSIKKAVTRALDALNNAKITNTYGQYIWIADN